MAQAEARGEAEATEGSRVWREDVDEGLRGGHVVGTRAGGGAEQVLGLGAERGVEMEVVTTVGLGDRGTRVQDAGWGIAPPGDGLVGSGGREVAEGGGDGEAVEMGAHAGGGPEQEAKEGAVQEVRRGAARDARGCGVVGVWVAGLGLPGEQGGEAKAGVQGVGQEARGQMKSQSGCAAMGLQWGVGWGAVMMVGSGWLGGRVRDAGWGIAPPGDGLVGSEGWEVAEGYGGVEVVGMGRQWKWGLMLVGGLSRRQRGVLCRRCDGVRHRTQGAAGWWGSGWLAWGFLVSGGTKRRQGCRVWSSR